MRKFARIALLVTAWSFVIMVTVNWLICQWWSYGFTWYHPINGAYHWRLVGIGFDAELFMMAPVYSQFSPHPDGTPEFAWLAEKTTDSANNPIARWGVKWQDLSVAGQCWGGRLFIRHWLILLVSIVIAAFASLPYITIDRRRSWRLKHGLCLKCGYDLRATPDRCPECGTVPPKAAITTHTPPG